MSRIKRAARKFLPEAAARKLRRLYYSSPLLRRLFFLPGDLLNRVRGRKSIPAGEINLVGDGDFEGVGRIFLEYFRGYCALSPGERVLDIGCGVGRMALPLAGFLDPGGSYEGFDVYKPAIDWCNREIAPRHSNFHIRHLNVRNDQYNPGGEIEAGRCSFPYPGKSFDFAFATSVFTHMLPADCLRYLGEIARVLRPGGRALLTFFLADSFVRGEAERGALKFRYRFQDCLVIDPQFPEAAIAHDLERILANLGAAGLVVREPILFGNWSGRPGGISSQDMIVVDRPLQ